MSTRLFSLFRTPRDNPETSETVNTPKQVRHHTNPRKPKLPQVLPGGVPVQGGGYLEGRPIPVNPAFSALFRGPRQNLETCEKRINPQPFRLRQTQAIQGISSSPSRRRPVRGGGCLGPPPGGVNSARDTSMISAHAASFGVPPSGAAHLVESLATSFKGQD